MFNKNTKNASANPLSEQEKLIVEVGMPLEKNLSYYHDMLIGNGFRNCFSTITHDIYFTNKALEGLTENQIKKACVRLRFTEDNQEKNENIKSYIIKKEKELINQGFKKVFDTKKIDYHYKKENMNSCIQLQDIKDIGLLVYYDNKNYYNYPLEKQRKLLLEELNSYGFNFKTTDLGLDKLRTLYYGKKMYSKNQNR